MATGDKINDPNQQLVALAGSDGKLIHRYMPVNSEPVGVDLVAVGDGGTSDSELDDDDYDDCESTCRGEDCDESTEDNEGWDGLCGGCADRAQLEDLDPHSLLAGESLIFSHADGDFDANDIGYEGIEASRDKSGAIQIDAITDLDFHWLDKDEAWLNANRAAIIEAVTTHFPGTTIDDAESPDWDNVVLRVDITPADQNLIPTGVEGLVDLVNANPAANLLAASLKTQALPWADLRETVIRAHERS